MGVIINPGDRPWYTSPSGITIVGPTKTYQTWDDMLKEQYPSKLAWVIDASGDPTVNEGSALYTWREHQGWVKIYETEYMDPVVNPAINNFVGWVSNPDQLNTLYPTGKDGMFALVGTTDSMWVWDGDTSQWVDSGADEVVVNNNWDSIDNKPEYFPSTFELVIDTDSNLTLGQTISQTVQKFTDADVELRVSIDNLTNVVSNLEISNISGLSEVLGRLKLIAFTADWEDLVNKPENFPSTFELVTDSDGKSISEAILTLQKADTSLSDRIIPIEDKLSNLQITDISGLYEKLDSIHSIAYTGSWNDLVDVPDHFTPEAHAHWWNDIMGSPEFALTTHTHAISDIENLSETITEIQDSLTQKLNTPSSISAGQMIVLDTNGNYVGQDVPSGDVSVDEFNSLEARVRALEGVVFEVDQLADQALNVLGYKE